MDHKKLVYAMNNKKNKLELFNYDISLISGVPENTVRRILSCENCTLEKLLAVVDALDMEIIIKNKSIRPYKD